MVLKVNSDDKVRDLALDLRNEITRYYAYALQRRIKNNLNDPAFGRYAGKPISDTGELAMGVKVIHDGKGQYRVVSTAPHSKAVEHGSLPHVVPLQALIDWLKRKFGANKENAIAGAKAVQKKIAEKGTEAQPFVEPAVEDDSILDEAIEKAIVSIKNKYR